KEKDQVIRRLQEQEGEWKQQLEQKEQTIQRLKSLVTALQQNEQLQQDRTIQSEQEEKQAVMDRNQMGEDSSWYQMYQNWSQGHESKEADNEMEAAVYKDQTKNPLPADRSSFKKQVHMPPELQADPNQISKFLRQHQTPYENHFLNRFKKE
ncbi:MAG: hypothetical protein WBZ33_14915, partial [Thermoactinomyces sp.]